MAEHVPQSEPTDAQAEMPASPETIAAFIEVAHTVPSGEPLISGGLEGSLRVDPATLIASDTQNLNPRTIARMAHRIPGEPGEEPKVTTYAVGYETDPHTRKDDLTFRDRFGRPVSERQAQKFIAHLTHSYIKGDPRLN